MKNQASQNGENLDTVLTTEYEQILNKSFQQLPDNSVIIYPNMGKDTVTPKLADQNGHDMLAISDQTPYSTSPSLYILTLPFEDYAPLKSLLASPEDAVLLSNGLDTTLSFEAFHKLLDDFDGQYIFHFDGDPKYDGTGRNMLKTHPNYINTTHHFLNQQDISEMRQQPLNIYERLKR